MTYFTHSTRDEWGTGKIEVEQTHEADLFVRVFEIRHGGGFGYGTSIVIPRDRVPDLIAALTRFMEETK